MPHCIPASFARRMAGGRLARNWTFPVTMRFRPTAPTSTCLFRTPVSIRSALQCRIARACAASFPFELANSFDVSRRSQDCRAAKSGNEFPPSNPNAHLPLPYQGARLKRIAQACGPQDGEVRSGEGRACRDVRRSPVVRRPRGLRGARIGVDAAAAAARLGLKARR